MGIKRDVNSLDAQVHHAIARSLPQDTNQRLLRCIHRAAVEHSYAINIRWPSIQGILEHRNVTGRHLRQISNHEIDEKKPACVAKRFQEFFTSCGESARALYEQ